MQYISPVHACGEQMQRQLVLVPRNASVSLMTVHPGQGMLTCTIFFLWEGEACTKHLVAEPSWRDHEVQQSDLDRDLR